MFKVGTNVKSKIHDDLLVKDIRCKPINNYAVIFDINGYEVDDDITING